MDYLNDTDFVEFLSINPQFQNVPKGNRGKFVSYHITTKTSILKDSGTDDDIYIRLYGANGKTDLIRLPDKSGDDTEKGQADVWVLGTGDGVSDVGPVWKIGISCQGTDAWRPEWIEVKRGAIFNNVWIAYDRPGRFEFGYEMQDDNPGTEHYSVRQLMKFNEDSSSNSYYESGTFIKIIDWTQSATDQDVKLTTDVKRMREITNSMLTDFSNRTKASIGSTTKSDSGTAVAGVGPSISSELRMDFETEFTNQLNREEGSVETTDISMSGETTLQLRAGHLHFFYFDSSTPAKLGEAEWFDGSKSAFAIPNFSQWMFSLNADKKVDANSEQFMQERPHLIEIWEQQNHGRKWPGFGKT